VADLKEALRLAHERLGATPLLALEPPWQAAARLLAESPTSRLAAALGALGAGMQAERDRRLLELGEALRTAYRPSLAEMAAALAPLSRPWGFPALPAHDDDDADADDNAERPN
jgi:hypothetical protein